jgi:hypothetical protein
MLKKLWDHFEELVGAVMLMIMVSIAFINVVTRYFIKYPLSFTEEIEVNLFVWLVMLGTSMAKDLRNMVSSSKIEAPVEIQSLQSRLGNWPVQIKLVPDNAPYLRNADLVIAADCTAYAMADFHGKFLGGEKTVCLIGCPKLDDAQTYEKKITQIIALNEPESITVVYMEVPCCGGLVRLITAAIEHAKVNVALKLVKIGIQGQIIEKETTKYVFSK